LFFSYLYEYTPYFSVYKIGVRSIGSGGIVGFTGSSLQEAKNRAITANKVTLRRFDLLKTVLNKTDGLIRFIFKG